MAVHMELKMIPSAFTSFSKFFSVTTLKTRIQLGLVSFSVKGAFLKARLGSVSSLIKNRSGGRLWPPVSTLSCSLCHLAEKLNPTGALEVVDPAC